MRGASLIGLINTVSYFSTIGKGVLYGGRYFALYEHFWIFVASPQLCFDESSRFDK